MNILTRKWVIWKKSIHKGGIKTCLDIRLEALKVIHRQNVFVKYFKGNWKLLIEAWKTNMQKYSLFAIFLFHEQFSLPRTFILITSYFKGNLGRKINIWQLKDIWFTSIQIYVIYFTFSEKSSYLIFSYPGVISLIKICYIKLLLM